MIFLCRAGSPFVLSMVGCVSLLLLGAYFLVGDEHSSPEESPVVASETAGAAFEPSTAGDANRSAKPENLAIRFTKPRSGPLAASERPLSADGLRAAEAGNKSGWGNSEVGHGVACLLRTNHEFRGQCEGTQLAALAEAIKADEPTYSFAGKVHNVGDELGGIGLELILCLHADAGIPLLVVHSFLNGFEHPACMVVPSAIPVAAKLSQQMHAPPAGRDGTNLPTPRDYEKWGSVTADEAASAMIFPAFAVRRDHTLRFNQLTSLPAAAAAILASHTHDIEFPSLKEISAEAAAELANHEGGKSATGLGGDNHLELGLAELPTDVAIALACRKSGLLTVGNATMLLATLSTEAAAALAQREGGDLELRVRDMPTEAQDVIASYRGRLSLRGGPRVLSSRRLVQKLCRDRHGDTLILNCSEMTPAAAGAFRDHGSGSTLMFTEPCRIDETVAKILAAYEGEIQFHKLIATTPEALTTLKASAPANQVSVAAQADAGSLASASSANSGVADASMAGRESEQPGRRNEVIEAISPTFSGLLDFPFGISEQAVTARCPVELANVEDQDGTFEGPGLKSLMAMHFPVTETDNLPVEFVLRDDSLIGMRVLIGYVTPDAFGGFVSSLATRLGKGQPEGSADDYRDAAVRFSEGKPHAPLRVAFNRRRTLVGLTWNEKQRKSVSEVIFRENWQPLDFVQGTQPAVTPPVALDTPRMTNSIGVDFVKIPAGTFTMGDAAGDSHEKPHRVTLTKPFYLGVHEVTNAQWKQVMGSVPGEWKDDDLPVERVSWEDAVEFCRKLSALPEERKAGRVYRLPTEAEWEYACRAGTTTKYSFGDDEKLLGDYGWFLGNSDNQTHPVGQKKPNAWGLYDMHGNVWECCSDWYGSYPDGEVTNPKERSSGSDRVYRGGGWGSAAGYCRSAVRLRLNPSDRINFLGFRLALSPSGAESPEAGK